MTTRRTNLATRPFYNVRAVHVGLAAAALVVVAFTAFNAYEWLRLRGNEAALGSHAEESEAQAQRLRAEAARIRTQIDQKELEVVSAAAREANEIIDRRAFSWTQLLTQLEATLPPDVRVTSVVPRLDGGMFKMAFTVEARRTEDIDDFIEALEKTGAFRDVVPLRVNEEELITADIESLYTPPVREPAAPEAPAPQGASRE